MSARIQSLDMAEQQTSIRILHLEDSFRDAEMIQDRLSLEPGNFEIVHVASGIRFAEALQQPGYDVILCDFNLPDFDGLSALKMAREKCPEVPVIIVSGAIDSEEAVGCLKAGATDYLLKQRLERLPSAVQRALEEARTQKQNRQQARLIDQATDAIMVWELDTCVTFWNPAAERLYGFAAEEVLGQPGLAAISRDAAEKCSAILDQVRRTGVWHGEMRQMTKDGRALIVLSRLTLLTDVQGRPTGILAVNHDITEAKALEQRLLRSQRQEALGTLAGGIAHDLNNALAPILLGVDLLKMQYPRGPGILDLFESSVKRAAAMIRQLLTFAKGTEGERSPVQISYLLREMEGLIGSTFPKNIRVRVACEDDLPHVVGDATQMHQVLLNLCVNARDAMPDGGILTIEAKQVEVGTTASYQSADARTGLYVALTVRDTGTGISPEIRDRIFDPFFSTKAPGKGTGLGLPTVLGIIKGHEGFLEISSQLGHGTAFIAYLPAESTAVPDAPQGPVPAPFRGHGETILFVDDEPTVRDVARTVLQRLNFQVVLAEDGMEGLMTISQQKTALRAVITDLHMPNQDGFAFVTALRRTLPDIPVVVSSGRLDGDAKERFQALGVTSFLGKPFTEGRLVEVLRGLFPAA